MKTSKTVIINTTLDSSRETILNFLEDKKSLIIADSFFCGNKEITEEQIDSFVKENGNQGFIYIDLIDRFDDYLKTKISFLRKYNQVNFIFSFDKRFLENYEKFKIRFINEYVLSEHLFKDKYELNYCLDSNKKDLNEYLDYLKNENIKLFSNLKEIFDIS